MSLILPFLVPLSIWDWFYSMLSAMMQPIYWAISGLLVLFHHLFSMFMNPDSGWTWIASIVSMTILIRTLLIPLFVKQINSSRKMQMLAPKAKALQEKYGNDRERLGQETMKLYKDEGANPAASCLPIFLQMPIFLGLFRVLDGAARGIARGQFFKDNPDIMNSLRHAKIFNAEVSGTFLPMNSGFGATQWVALVLIILMTVTLFITQLQLMRKNMPPEALTGPMAQQQKMMLYLFPVIYMITGVSIPIGVMVYWLASNLWTMGQQYILIHNNPAPNTPAYVDWEERMRAKGKDPDAILRKRMGTSRNRAAAASDPSKVARQGTGRTTASPPAPSAPTGGASTTNTPPRVARQQPNRQTRSNRKQSPQARPKRPDTTAGPSKE